MEEEGFWEVGKAFAGRGSHSGSRILVWNRIWKVGSLQAQEERKRVLKGSARRALSVGKGGL